MKGINLVIADALSRTYVETLDIETEQPRILNVMFDNFPNAILLEVKKATLEDAYMQLLMECIIEEWPEASYQDGIIVKGEAIIISKSLRTDMKSRLHSAHLGYNNKN